MAICKFCDIVKKKVSDYVVWENRKFIAFLNIHPTNPGHCLLIPKKHVDYFFDMENKLYHGLFSTAKRLEKPLRNAMQAKRIGIYVVGFDVPHAHLHMVPLTGKGQMDNPMHYKTTPEELKKIQKKLASCLKTR